MAILSELKEKYIDKNYDTAVARLEECREDLTFINKPTDISGYTSYIRRLTSEILLVDDVTLGYDITELKQLLEDSYKNLVIEHNERIVAVNEKYESLANSRIVALEEEAKEHNKQVLDEFNKENSVYLELESKRIKLEKYSDDVISLCSVYGITTSDVTIDNSSFGVSELGPIYDEYIEFMSKASSRENPIGVFREKFKDVIFQSVVFGIIAVLSFTVFLDLVGVAFFIAIVVNQIKAKDKMKTYAVLLGLIFNVHPLELGFKEDVDTEQLVEEKVNEDEDERVAAVAEEWESALEEISADDPTKDLQEDRLLLTTNSTEVQEEFDGLIESFNQEKEELKDEIRVLLETAESEFEEAKSKAILLGDAISKSVVLDTNFRLGCRDGIVEEYRDVGLANIIIKPYHDEELMKMFVQVLLANALCNVKAGAISVQVYDPNKRGKSLVSFYTPDLDNYIKFGDDNLEEIVRKLKDYADQNMKSMGGLDINDYNKECIETGRTAKEYRLLIVLSQPKKFEDDEALGEFMAYSATLGVIIWLVADKVLPETTIFNKPFSGVENPYVVDTDMFGKKVGRLLAKELKDNKPAGLPWKEFMAIVVPDAKTWTYNTDEFIDFDPGFRDGDPSEFRGFTLGNVGNVHGLAVGGTGAGKSVFLNHLVATQCKKYSPRALELWLVDYKGVEFKFYLPNAEFPYMLPHIKACLCTSDGDYAGSLYDALEKETQRRFAFLMDAGFKNMKEYNEHLRSEGREDECLSRILFINDEFQVIYEKAEPNTIAAINKALTSVSKLGRAAGVHLLFTSQSMRKTLPADTLQQFSLRFALRCDKEVSQEVLNSENASNIKEAYGYLYCKSLEHKTAESQPRYRTPFLSDLVLREHIKKLAEMAVEQNMPKHDVITYMESTKHDISELDAFYESEINNKENSPKSGLFVLGNRMTYSAVNRAPENIILTPTNNSHILAAFGETVDLVNFYKTMRCNISHFREESMVYCNSQVADLHYLCELDKDVPEDMQDFSNEKMSIKDQLILFKSIYDSRVDTGTKDQPAYFFLIGWDKAVGFGIDRDQSFSSELAKLLQLCGEYNMHFIFIGSVVGSISPNVQAACGTKVVGRCDEATSTFLLNSRLASKPGDMKNGYMYIWKKGVTTRAKTYLSKQDREIKLDEFVM